MERKGNRKLKSHFFTTMPVVKPSWQETRHILDGSNASFLTRGRPLPLAPDSRHIAALLCSNCVRWSQSYRKGVGRAPGQIGSDVRFTPNSRHSMRVHKAAP
jgi:hypothetical protein